MRPLRLACWIGLAVAAAGGAVTALRLLPPAAAQDDAAKAPQPRLWRDATGQYQVEATFEALVGDQVRLRRRADGVSTQVPLDRLSPADQAFARNLAAAAAAAPAASSAGAAGTAAAATGWPRFLGPTGDAVSPETGLGTTFPPDGPRERWRTPLGTGFSGLTVSGGRLYTQYGRDGREWVAGFDAATGKELWKFDAGPDFAEGRSFGPRATPCLDGGRLYAIGAHGHLACLDAATGSPVWELAFLETFGLRPHEEGHSPSPQVDGDRLILSGGDGVFALDKGSGKLLWRALSEKMGHATPRFATLDGRRQLLALSLSHLVGLDPADGAELWRTPQQGVNIAVPVVGPGDGVFTAAAYGYGSQLTRVSGGRAERVYQNNCLASHTATAVVHQGFLYGFHDRIGTLRCVDFATGEEKWETRGPGKGNLILADGQLVILTEDGRLALAPASPEGYQATAEARLLSGTSYTAPSLVDGWLYLRSNEEMVCVSLKP